MQCCIVYSYLENALHVLGGTSTHHQEGIQLYLQHLVLVTPLLLPAATVTVWQIPDAVDTGVCPPDDGCRYHPKPVEHFPDINSAMLHLVGYILDYTYNAWTHKCSTFLTNTFIYLLIIDPIMYFKSEHVWRKWHVVYNSNTATQCHTLS
jgi:hypothetical protein